MKTKQLNLNEREMGAWFAPFEYELIWTKEREHIGWVVHTSSKTFKLKSTPFSDHFKKYLYIAPSKRELPENNECVDIKPLKIIQEPKFNNKNTFGVYTHFCLVDTYQKYDIMKHLPTPDIKRSDFLHLCSIDWIDAEQDFLDIMLALQAVSCPTSTYGSGGLGAIGSKLTEKGNLSKSILPQLKKTYNNNIPINFKKTGSKYYFKLIEKNIDIRSLENRRKTSLNEINYCNPCTKLEDVKKTTSGIPIQIPFLARQASFKKDKSNDAISDRHLLIQYQLTALMYNPEFNDDSRTIGKIQKNIINMNSSKLRIKIDSNSINKLALSFSRLDFNNEPKQKYINESKTMLLSWLDDWDYYTLEADSLQRSRRTMQASDINNIMTHDEQRFLVELSKLHDETGEKWIDRELLEQRLHKKLEVHNLHDIAQNLCDTTIIIQKNNFNQFHRLDL